jgi:hypothetical protein
MMNMSAFQGYDRLLLEHFEGFCFVMSFASESIFPMRRLLSKIDAHMPRPAGEIKTYYAYPRVGEIMEYKIAV